MCIFVVDENEFSSAVLKNVGDFLRLETDVDGGQYCAGGQDAMVSVCIALGSEAY
jgi:hypothetical protein